jgi:hypothetical protein
MSCVDVKILVWVQRFMLVFIMNSDSNGFEMSLCSSWSADVAFFPAEGIGVLFLNKLRHDHISIPQLRTLKNLAALLSPDSVGTFIRARVNQHLLAHHEGWMVC